MWVLRDFTLKLVDQEGNKISSKQYLENALKEQKGFSEAIEQKNRIRRLLTHFFKERDCCTLVRPTEDEKDLQDLAKMSDSELRRDFVEQLGRLKQKAVSKVKPKQMNGHYMNGPMILELAHSYVAALNEGCVPNIENAWSNVCSFEQERTYKESLEMFRQEASRLSREKGENLKEELDGLKERVFSQMKGKFLGDMASLDKFERRLKRELKTISKRLVQENQKRIE